MDYIKIISVLFLLFASSTSFGQTSNSEELTDKMMFQCKEFIEHKIYQSGPLDHVIWIATVTKVNNASTKCDFSITMILNPFMLDKICASHYFILKEKDLILIQFKNVDEAIIDLLSYPEIEGDLLEFTTTKNPLFGGEWLHDPEYRVIKIRQNYSKFRDYVFPHKRMPEKYSVFCID